MNGKHLGLHSDSYCGVGSGDVVVCPAGAQQTKHCDVVLVTICYKRAR